MNNFINIFCFIGGTGSGKSTYLNYFLNETSFLKEMNIKPLIYGTTRKMRENEQNGVDYYFFEYEEFKKMDQKDILEYRKYNTLNDGEIYYFTLLDYINKDSNIICSISPKQYDSLYDKLFELNQKEDKYRMYIIDINIELHVRIVRLLNRAKTDMDIYEFCRRLVQEKEEFENSRRTSNDVCSINNTSSCEEIIQMNIDRIKEFIKNKTSN